MKKLIIFEGLDGSGKSEVAMQVIEKLKKEGHNAVYIYEPSRENEFLDIITKQIFKTQDPLLQYFLFISLRLEHIKKYINFYMEDQKTEYVICDRFHFSTYAYQIHYNDLNKKFDNFNELEQQITKLIFSQIKKIDIVFYFKEPFLQKSENSFDGFDMEKIKNGYDECFYNLPYYYLNYEKLIEVPCFESFEEKVDYVFQNLKF